MLFDAHNHYQDARLAPHLHELMPQMLQAGLKGAVVNGSDESDWGEVAALARSHPWMKPSYGLHPWYVQQRTRDWSHILEDYLLQDALAEVGEVGLDRWIENPDIEAQLECFRVQLALAVKHDRAITIHCLRAWGLLQEEMRTQNLPRRGFLLHSYGGPVEMVPFWVAQGAYFSISPYYAHERKEKQLRTFAAVPLNRLLAETDAPDMWPPNERCAQPLKHEGKPINHPLNLSVSYELLCQVKGLGLDELKEQLAQNYQRLFERC